MSLKSASSAVHAAAAGTVGSSLGRLDVPLLGGAELPDLVYPDALRGDTADVLVGVIDAGFAGIREQPR